MKIYHKFFTSLRFRLIIFIMAILFVSWFFVALLVWKETVDYVDEFYDTQQMLLAKRLSVLEINELHTVSKNIEPKKFKKKYRGDLEDDALRFTLFNLKGEEILNDGEHEVHFIFYPDLRGFVNTNVLGSKDIWRIVWLPSENGQFVVAVGQEHEYRQEMMEDMLWGQLLPWSALLPILFIGLFWIISHELKPFREISTKLDSRSPVDSSPLSIRRTPTEVLPLIDSLNALFKRIDEMITNERAFISDVAHELRTPLSGLRVQAEVATLSLDNPNELASAMSKLINGIDRTSHLSEQLLVLNRIEALHNNNVEYSEIETSVELDWQQLIQKIIVEYQLSADQKNIHLDLSNQIIHKNVHCHSSLIEILLHNLINNAIKYTPNNGYINIHLDEGRLSIENTCSNLSEAELVRLGERFYRPPGQTEIGSGLGLSIVKRIADIHKFSVSWHFSESIFSVQLKW